MAGRFESIIRPFLSPNLRPTKKPTPAPVERDEEDGVSVIAGRSASLINLNVSARISMNRSKVTEVTTEITFDVGRVKNAADPSQHVDVEFVKRLRTLANDGTKKKLILEEPAESETLEILKRNQKRDVHPNAQLGNGTGADGLGNGTGADAVGTNG